MDANLFYVFNLALFGALVLASMSRNDLIKIALPFMMGIFGIIVMTTVNTDGGLNTTPATPTWPTLYLPLFGVLLNFAMTFYNGVKGR